MNDHDIDLLWRESSKPSINPEMTRRVIAQDRRQARRFKLRMGFFGFNMSLATCLGLWALATGRTTPAEAWPALLTLVVLWGTYIEFIRHRRREARHRDQLRENTRSLFQWALRQTRVASREIGLLLAANALVVMPLTALGVARLLHSNQMTVQQASSFSLFAVLVLGGNLVILGTHLVRTLRPRERRLEHCLKTLVE